MPGKVATAVVRPDPPASLYGRKMRDTWRELVDALADAQLITRLDVTALELLVRTLVAYREAADNVARHGLITWTETNASAKKRLEDPDLEPVLYPTQNPSFPLMNRLGATCSKMLAEFGMSPSSRTRVEPVGDEEGETAFERLARESREARTETK